MSTAQLETTMKRCPSSDHEGPNPLPVAEFNRNRSKKDGLQVWCRTCKNRDSRRWRQANPEKKREQGRRWTQANPEKKREQGRRWTQANPEKKREQIRRTLDRLRTAVFDHYGRSCRCCGTTEQLTIDHIDGNGKAHRIELFGRNEVGTAFYRWLVKNNFPPGYQVLCRPCNASKRGASACRLDHRKAA